MFACSVICCTAAMRAIPEYVAVDCMESTTWITIRRAFSQRVAESDCAWSRRYGNTVTREVWRDAGTVNNAWKRHAWKRREAERSTVRVSKQRWSAVIKLQCGTVLQTSSSQVCRSYTVERVSSDNGLDSDNSHEVGTTDRQPAAQSVAEA